MQKILRWLLIFFISLFWFWFYKNNFDINKYVDYLTNQWANNFQQTFNIQKPNTRLSFLYFDENVDIIDPLDAELERLNKIAELWIDSNNETNNSWQTLEQTTTWEDTNQENIEKILEEDITISGEDIDEAQLTWQEQDYESLFEEEFWEQTNQDTKTWDNLENDFSDITNNQTQNEDSENLDKTEIPGTNTTQENTWNNPKTQNENTETPKNNLTWTESNTWNWDSNSWITKENLSSWNLSNKQPINNEQITNTGSTDSNNQPSTTNPNQILQKRLEQYKQFKQTLEN